MYFAFGCVLVYPPCRHFGGLIVMCGVILLLWCILRARSVRGAFGDDDVVCSLCWSCAVRVRLSCMSGGEI